MNNGSWVPCILQLMILVNAILAGGCNGGGTPPCRSDQRERSNAWYYHAHLALTLISADWYFLAVVIPLHDAGVWVFCCRLSILSRPDRMLIELSVTIAYRRISRFFVVKRPLMPFNAESVCYGVDCSLIKLTRVMPLCCCI